MVRRYDSDYVDRARQWSESEEGRVQFRLRKTVIEGLFGQAKNFHGLSRAKFRGLEKLKIQVPLTATALNLKKLVRYLTTNISLLHYLLLCYWNDPPLYLIEP